MKREDFKMRFKVEQEQGRTAEEGTEQKSDTRFGALVLEEAKRVYGEEFDFMRCMISRSCLGDVVTFGFHQDFLPSQIRFNRITELERKELRSVIKMALYEEFNGIGEELIDNIEEDVLKALDLRIGE